MVVILLKFKVFLLFFLILSFNAKITDTAIFSQYSSTKKVINKNELFTCKKANFQNIDDLLVNVQKDTELIEKTLKFYGFFDAKISHAIANDKFKYIVKFFINEGQRYKISAISCNLDSKFILAHNINYQKYIGKNFDISYISQIEQEIINLLDDNGFPNAKISKIDIMNNSSKKNVSIKLICDRGEKQLFGETEITGLQNTNPQLIKKFITWKPGDTFSKKQIEFFKNKIAELGLFSDINVYEAKKNSRINISIVLTEDKKYALEFGLKFTTSNNINYKNAGIKKLKGVVAHVSWINSNFGKQMDKLILSAEGMPFYERHKIINAITRNISPDYKFKVELLKNELLMERYRCNYYAEQSQKWFNKYIKRGFVIGASLLQQQREKFNTSYKLFIENYKLKTFSEHTNDSNMFRFINFEYTLDIDMRDNFIDPIKGMRSVFSITPEICLNKSSNILMIDITHAFYVPLFREFNIFVPWCKFKSILSKSSSLLPADKMLYSGGPKSIRGYYVDFAGNVENDIPTGGKSVLELGIELRKKFNNTWGGCLFVEGARVCDNVVPTNGKFYNAYGFGIRYYSELGPIRVDIGFPFHKRRGVDSFAQISISLGHRF